jgi:hypothetical protein
MSLIGISLSVLLVPCVCVQEQGTGLTRIRTFVDIREMTSVTGMCACLYKHTLTSIRCKQGVTKRRRLSLLTNSAMHIRVQMWGGCGVSANEYSCAHLNFGDLPPYLTYGIKCLGKIWIRN